MGQAHRGVLPKSGSLEGDSSLSPIPLGLIPLLLDLVGLVSSRPRQLSTSLCHLLGNPVSSAGKNGQSLIRSPQNEKGSEKQSPSSETHAIILIMFPLC